jgi:hypothetical protein
MLPFPPSSTLVVVKKVVKKRPAPFQRQVWSRATCSACRFSVQPNITTEWSRGRLRRRHVVAHMLKRSDAQTAHGAMFHVVMPYGPSGDFKKATRVASVPTVEAAWGYLDDVRVRLASLNLPLENIELVVVDEGREPVPRPNQMIQ